MTSALPRITARVDSDTQELLTQATAIAGMSSINSFVLSAAIEKAKTIIQQEHALQLSQKDATTLITALDTKTQTKPQLQRAATRYANKKQH